MALKIGTTPRAPANGDEQIPKGSTKQVKETPGRSTQLPDFPHR